MLDKYASTIENPIKKPIVESVEKLKNQLHSLTSNIKIVVSIRDQITFMRIEMAPRRASDVVAVKKTKTIKSRTPKKTDNYDGLRVRGIKEKKAKSRRQRCEHDAKEVKDILVFLNIDSRSTPNTTVG